MSEDLMRRAHELFDPIAAPFLEREGVDQGWIFGSEGLRVRGKIFAFLGHEGDLVVKVPRERVDALVTDHGARRLQTGTREMKEWVVLEQRQAALWAPAVDEAFAYLDRITPGGR